MQLFQAHLKQQKITLMGLCNHLPLIIIVKAKQQQFVCLAFNYAKSLCCFYCFAIKRQARPLALNRQNEMGAAVIRAIQKISIF